MEPIELDYAFQLRTCAISEVPELLQIIGDINVRGLDGKTALHNVDDVDKCKLLIEYGADVNMKDERGRAPLHYVKNADICKTFLENGADVNAKDSDERNALHFIENAQICRILIENGANIDNFSKNGTTPLMQAVVTPEQNDLVHALLYYGADPKIAKFSDRTAFSFGVGRFDQIDEDLLEILFNYSYDHVKEPIHWKLLIKVAAVSDLYDIFLQLLDSCSEIKFSDRTYEESKSERIYFLYGLFHFEPDNLSLFLHKYKPVVVKCLSFLKKCPKLFDYWSGELPEDLVKYRRILTILDEHNLLEDFIEVFSEHFQSKCLNFVKKIDNLEQLTRLILIFVSYGLDPRDTVLDRIYNKYGYCELFRILLHCNLMQTHDCFRDSLLTRLIYDINLSIDISMGKSVMYIYKSSILQVLEQFAHAKLIKCYLSQYGDREDIVARLNRLPEIPKLVELARNVARRHIIDKFNMKTASQLYTYIDHLEISHVYKSILSLEKKLYV